MPFPKKISNEAILEHALQIVRADGLAALSMRELAASLGVQASSLYRHYQGREDLEAALAGRAAAELEARMRIASQGRSPEDAFRAVGWEYVRFAREDEALFELLIGPHDPGPEGNSLWNLILRVVAGITGDPDDTSSAVAVWSFLHGFAVLDQSGQFGASGPQQGYLTGIEALIAGLPRRS